MKKRILVCLLAAAMLLALTGCFCQHEVWQDADCVNPKTCTECGKTEGAALGHSWAAATCDKAQTCEICGLTEGEALGHAWVDATCTEAKTCSTCKQTEGEALGHAWVDATTEAPKTCSTCNATEGERIITDERFTTAAAAPILGKWTAEVDMDGTVMEIPDFPGTFKMNVTYTFGPAGDILIEMSLLDPEAFNTLMSQYLADTMYAEFAKEGMNKEAADAAMQSAYGMTVSQYASALLSTMDMASQFEAMDQKGVYYVKDGSIYRGEAWEDELTGSTYTLENDTLTIADFEVGSKAVQLKRVVEE